MKHSKCIKILQVFVMVILMNMSAAYTITPGNALVNLKEINPHIVIDMKYATHDNFLKQKVYDDPNCYLLTQLAQKLDKAQRILEQDGLGLKVFDGFRPLSVQKKMWEIEPDSRFVANPNTGGSIHNRAAAVDLTLVDADGKELEMPTPFDSFEERAYQYSKEPTPQQRANRMLLRKVMLEVGLEYIQTEWWHYQLPKGKEYPVLDK